MAEPKVPGHVLEALEILRRAGAEAYIVGGAVRDLLLGREPKDYDIAVNLPAEKVAEVFTRAGWGVSTAGLRYGVVTVAHPGTGETIDIAMMRRETYPRPGRPVVEPARSIEEDLARRDFTINAMAYNPLTGELVDPFGGARDLRLRVVRFVGEPEERIREDPARILRAIRFASELGFTIEPRSMEAIKALAGELEKTSWERRGTEIAKALRGAAPWRLPVLLHETGVYKHVMPEIGPMAEARHDTRGHHYGETVLEHTVDVLRRVSGVERGLVHREAALLHDVGKPATRREEAGRVTFHGHEVVGARMAEEILRRLRRPLTEIEPVKTIVRYHMVPYSMAASGLTGRDIAARLVARHGRHAYGILVNAYGDTGEEYWLDLARQARRMAEERERKRLVTGHDILRLGVPPGPAVRRLLEKAAELQARGMSREEILRELKRIIENEGLATA